MTKNKLLVEYRRLSVAFARINTLLDIEINALDVDYVETKINDYNKKEREFFNKLGIELKEKDKRFPYVVEEIRMAKDYLKKREEK